jgi:DNA-binding NtrC family response regulator
VSGQTSPPVVILVIDDDEMHLELVQSVLQSGDVEIHATQTALSGWKLFLEKRPHCVLLDLALPGISGMDLLERMLDADPGADIILMTGHYSTQSAVEAIQKGASDYFNKPLDVEKLRLRIRSLVADRQRRHRASRLEQELVGAFTVDGIVGRSPLMLDVFDRIRRVAPHFRTALLTGNTGTGKELVAKALHAKSPVASRPFIVCNCASLVDTLAESQLFGHVKGAFTGAHQDVRGFFEHADRGTIFLDEIGEVPLPLQAKLLRVLQTSEIQRVGSPAVKPMDIRVIAATNRNLKQLVQSGQFREDLYYRLSMIEIKLPRLAERPEDLPFLERHFIERFSTAYGKTIRGITRRAQNLLARHSWPGNVRELENVLGNACMMVETEFVDVSDLPPFLQDKPLPPAGLVSLEELDRQYVRRVLDEVGGNKLRAAEILGISRATLYAMLARMGPSDEFAM